VDHRPIKPDAALAAARGAQPNKAEQEFQWAATRFDDGVPTAGRATAANGDAEAMRHVVLVLSLTQETRLATSPELALPSSYDR
jgi:hypothetical protein